MKNTSEKAPKLVVQFPAIGLVLVLALFCAVVKLCGGTGLSWLMVLTVVPMGLYVGWCLAWLLLAYLCYGVAKLMSRKSEK